MEWVLSDSLRFKIKPLESLHMLDVEQAATLFIEFEYAVRCRYNGIQLITILHKALR